MHSGSNAAKIEEPRERFLGPISSLGIVLAFLLLLFLLFPERNINEIMARSSAAGAVVLGYREAILRARPEDTVLRIRLAEGLVAAGQFSRALAVLNEHKDPTGAQDRLRCLKVRYRALKGCLRAMPAGIPEWKSMLEDFSGVTRELAKNGPEPAELQQMVTEAQAFGAKETADFLAGKYAELTAGLQNRAGGMTPDYYRENARFCFNAMRTAKGHEQRRSLFAKGVRFLQSGNLAGEALVAGEAHMDGLATDRDTLLLMTKVALAAGKPDIAQRYISRALGMDRGRNLAGGT